MEISKDKENEERIVYKSISIAKTVNPDKYTKKKSSLFYPFWEEKAKYIQAISLTNVISIRKKPIKEKKILP